MPRAARIVIPIAAVLGVFVVASSFVRTDTRTFRIPSESMSPTIEVGDRITVNEEAYDDAAPQRGDIVVSHPPQGADVFFVQRIVAVPGDRLRVRDGRAIVNGRPLDEPYAQDCPDPSVCTFRGEIVILPDHYFVMGDNRSASDDSRFWGPIPRDQIVGRVDDCWPLGLKCSKTRDPG